MTERIGLRGRRSENERFEDRLSRAKNGDAEALGGLLEGCRMYLLRAANQSLESSMRPKEGASDLVQRTFVAAQLDFTSFRGTTLPELLAWLNRILERQLAGQVRHYKQAAKRNLRREVPLDAFDRAATVGLVDGHPIPSDRAAAEDERGRVRRALACLSEDDRRVIELRAWQRLPFAQIAGLMNRSADAAERLWLRALARLKHELESNQ